MYNIGLPALIVDLPCLVRPISPPIVILIMDTDLTLPTTDLKRLATLFHSKRKGTIDYTLETILAKRTMWNLMSVEEGLMTVISRYPQIEVLLVPMNT
jgi:hypothetical protein